MRSLFAKCAVVVVLSAALTVMGASLAFADTVINVKPKSGSDAYKTVQEALDKAHKKASAKNKYVIKVKKGSYKLSHHLSIYSNTTLDLTGVKLKSVKRADGHMIKVGASSTDKKKGYAYKNITIKGGDLNNNGNKATTVLVAHAKNFMMQNVKLHNSKDAHLMEAAGVDGLTVENCKFYDQKQNVKTRPRTLEALQLDILVKLHMPQYRPQALPTKNVVIKNCTFKNVPRGVGSHTAFHNGYTKNVQILDNTFTGCKSFAIQTRNFLNCTIEGNTISKCSSGIAIESISDEGTYFGSGFSKKYKTPIQDQGIVIRNNTIAVKGSDPYYGGENVGIRVSGCDIKKKLKKTADTDAIPKGNYYVSGVSIERNNITSAAHGIRLDDARNTTISGNTLTFNGNAKKAKKGFYGIQLFNKSTGNIVESNTVSRFCTNGIFVSTKSSASRIEGNVVSGSGKYGIVLLESSASRIESNHVANSGVVGIYVMTSSSAGTIADNVIKTVTGGNGISVFDKSKVTSVARNTISSVADNGIIVQQKSTVSSILDNVISGAKKYGVYVDASSSAKDLSGNDISASLKDIVLK